MTTFDEPVTVFVVGEHGQVVAELLVNPLKKVANLKRQIAGLEGTPAGNQALLFENTELDNKTPLHSLGVQSSLTLQLRKQAPMLSGRLRLCDLKSLLDDAKALDEAIDAYSAQPAYSPDEVRGIIDAVSRTLVAKDGRHKLQEAAVKAAMASLETKTNSSARSQKVSFTRALRSALLVIWEATLDTSAADISAAALQNQSGVDKAEKAASASSSGPPVLDAPLAAPHSESTAHVRTDIQTAAVTFPNQVNLTPVHWRGAGSELLTHLSRRLAAVEGTEGEAIAA